VEASLPGVEVAGNPGGAPRSGAFEVVLKRGAGGGSGEGVVLWSKLETGEPSNQEAAGAVAGLVVRELKRALGGGGGDDGRQSDST